MTEIRVVSLRARAYQSALLSFATEGIVQSLAADLGQQVTGFDLSQFYSNLGAVAADSPARLSYDSQGIASDPNLQQRALMTLRAEPQKALLDKAVGAREIAFYSKYRDSAAVIDQIRTYYAPERQGSKIDRLNTLSNISDNQAALLADAYKQDGRDSVVKSTAGTLSSNTNGAGLSSTTNVGSSQNDGSDNSHQSIGSGGSTNNWSLSDGQSGQNPLAQDYSHSLSTSGGTNQGQSYNVGWNLTSSNERNTGYGQTQSTNSASQIQQTTNTDYGYRVPSLESMAQNQRTQAGLIDEQYSQLMFVQDLPYLERVFQNELQGIDLDVKQLQVAYLNTFLLPPIDGQVTGIFKRPGERVAKGEPAIRIESDQRVLLEGTLVCRGEITVGAVLQIESTLFSAPDAATTSLTGTVSLARGHQSGDDWWEVGLVCDNLSADNKQIVPSNYHFDPTNTTISLA
jgi:hypothetical protein